MDRFEDATPDADADPESDGTGGPGADAGDRGDVAEDREGDTDGDDAGDCGGDATDREGDADTGDAPERPVPFPVVEEGTDAPHLAVAPDGTRYAVPSGMHERLRRTALPAGDRGADPDPKVDLALSGWLLLHTDGLTDRLYVDAPDGATDAAPVRRFARERAVGFHPSGESLRSGDPERLAFEDRGD